MPASANIPPTSRYVHTPVLFRYSRGQRELGLWKTDFRLSEPSDYTLYTVRAADVGRLDLVSYMHYGTCSYWWAIAYASGVANQFAMSPGDVLRVPALSVIQSFINPTAVVIP